MENNISVNNLAKELEKEIVNFDWKTCHNDYQYTTALQKIIEKVTGFSYKTKDNWNILLTCYQNYKKFIFKDDIYTNKINTLLKYNEFEQSQLVRKRKLIKELDASIILSRIFEAAKNVVHFGEEIDQNEYLQQIIRDILDDENVNPNIEVVYSHSYDQTYETLYEYILSGIQCLLLFKEKYNLNVNRLPEFVFECLKPQFIQFADKLRGRTINEKLDDLVMMYIDNKATIVLKRLGKKYYNDMILVDVREALTPKIYGMAQLSRREFLARYQAQYTAKHFGHGDFNTDDNSIGYEDDDNDDDYEPEFTDDDYDLIS
jgi:hypothetical protein